MKQKTEMPLFKLFNVYNYPVVVFIMHRL